MNRITHSLTHARRGSRAGNGYIIPDSPSIRAADLGYAIGRPTRTPRTTDGIARRLYADAVRFVELAPQSRANGGEIATVGTSITRGLRAIATTFGLTDAETFAPFAPPNPAIHDYADADAFATYVADTFGADDADADADADADTDDADTDADDAADADADADTDADAS